MCVCARARTRACVRACVVITAVITQSSGDGPVIKDTLSLVRLHPSWYIEAERVSAVPSGRKIPLMWK